MTDDDDDHTLEEAMRKKLGLPDASLPADEAHAIENSKKQPVPVKVLVSRERFYSDDYGNPHEYFRWFFIAVDSDGTRRPLFNTAHKPAALKEVDRYQKLGVPLEVFEDSR